MIFTPSPLGKTILEQDILKQDKSACIRIGPCGFGEHAIYLNSFFFSRRYYVCYSEVQRVFKRIAMSKGGFTGSGMFGTMPYLVVQYNDGKEKQCNFKIETDVDKALSFIERKHPDIPTRSAEAEKKLAQAEAEERASYLDKLSAQAEETVKTLELAKGYIQKRPSLSEALTDTAKQKRIVDNIKPALRIGSVIFAALCILAVLAGLFCWLQHMAFGMYLALFGGVFFLFILTTGALPSRWNNKKKAQQEWLEAVHDMADYLEERKHFPTPPQYAHPIVLDRMIRVVRQGRAKSPAQALTAVKDDLRRLNSSVTVSQKEHDEVVAVKPLFLVCDYKDQL